MKETIDYFKCPPPIDGISPVVMYDERSIPNGFTIEMVALNTQKMPYVVGKGNPPSVFYPK